MAGIIFYYEDSDTDVWSGKNNDAWNYALKASSSFENVIIINNSTSEPEDINREFALNKVTSLEDAIALTTGTIAQIVCPWNYPDSEKVSLWDYDHSADWYITGPAAGWANAEIPGATKVYVPQDGVASLHSIHIATTVLMHRYKVIQGL